MSRINIAEEFTDSPGARLRKDGEFSGEQFREELLIPRLKALKPNEILEINFDGPFGYLSYSKIGHGMRSEISVRIFALYKVDVNRFCQVERRL